MASLKASHADAMQATESVHAEALIAAAEQLERTEGLHSEQI
jgi:hypothetical protein